MHVIVITEKEVVTVAVVSHLDGLKDLNYTEIVPENSKSLLKTDSPEYAQLIEIFNGVMEANGFKLVPKGEVN